MQYNTYMYLIYILINIPVTLQLNFFNEETGDTSILKCTAKMYNIAPESNAFIVYKIDKNLMDFSPFKNNKGFAIYNTDDFDSTTQLWNFRIFILFITTIEEFNNLIAFLSSTVLWDSRAKFIIAYYGNKDIGEIFNTAWKFWIFNINIVMKNNTETNVYTYYPYQKHVCGEYYDYKMLLSCNDDFVDVFPKKIPLNLYGCKINLMAYVIPPYVINLNMPREESGKTGIEVTIIYNVAKRMNLTLNFLKNPHRHWGYRFDDGSFSLMFKALKNRETDIIFGFTYKNQSYYIDFDASFTHLADASIWFFPTAPQMAQWKNLTNIFEPDLWLAIFLMFLINGIAWWIVGRTRELSDDFNDLTICIMSSMYVLLQGSVEGPQTWKLRMIFILWLMTCVLIFTAHQSALISILTSPLYERQMKTLEELVASGSEFGFYPTIEDAYKDSNPTNQAILHQYQECPLTAECLNRTAFQRDYAVVKNRRQVLYLMPRYYTFPNGRPMLYDTDIASFTTKETYYVNKGYPLLERIDQLLMLLTSNGLITKWDADTRFYVLKIESDGAPESLNLNHLQGAFFVYSFGAVFAIIALTCELIMGKCFKYKKNYKQ